MKNIVEQMAFYQSYHRSAGCKATHFFGVPLVTFAILIPMGWLAMDVSGLRVSAAMVFVISTLAYYFRLEKSLAIVMVLVMVPISVCADWASRLPFRDSLIVFSAAFILGWVFQLAGHAIEGKRPALADNFFPSVFTAPLFLVAEVLFALGWGKELRTRIAMIKTNAAP